ncbi:MAG: fluoride efflux transporter CrcB [Planctomycetaceae bacterium]|nr:fluoride efflux transporter CrcB [Planctomycetaceae bacterium]
MQFLHLAAIGLGGCLGAISRFYINLLFLKRFPEASYWGTFSVNLAGCLAIGFLMALAETHQRTFPQWLFYLLVVGYLGSLTTFSTFGFQTIELLRESRAMEALVFVGVNLIGGLLAVVLGYVLSSPWT